MFKFEIYSHAFKWMINLKDDLLKAKSLEYVVIVALSISVVTGFLLFLVDPNIRSVGDGIWYAWVSITHVGYGDVVPSSLLGRLLGTVLILLGLGMLALFTASSSSALIGRDLGSVREEMITVEKETHDIEREESRVLKELARIHQRLDQLEARLNENRKD